MTEAQYWDVGCQSWETALASPSFDNSGAPMLLFRVEPMHCPNFADEVRRLEEEAPSSLRGRQLAKERSQTAWAEAIHRDHFEGFVYVVLWFKVRAHIIQ